MTGQPAVEEPRPCNYVAAEHQGPTRRYAPGWRCVLHTPEVIHQQHQ